jgi:uncharacterized membrane protein
MLPGEDSMKTWLLLTVWVFALLLVPASSAITYTTIDFPGALATFALGINTAGDIVGYYSDPTFITHGFLLSQGVFTTIDAPGSSQTFCADLNDSGEIVGYYLDASGRGPHGFLLEGQTYTKIDFPGGLSTRALSINNAGEVVGYYFANANGKTLGFEDINGVLSSFNPLPHSTQTLITELTTTATFSA